MVRVVDGNRLIDFSAYHTTYPYKHELADMFEQGESGVKTEIFCQKTVQSTVAEWVEAFDIRVAPSREWLYKLISHVKTDPYKLNEKRLLKEGGLLGNNELLYGYHTSSSMTPTAKSASSASSARDASRQSWAGVKTAIGPLEGLEYPKFAKNKFATAGHWKINTELVSSFSNWFDPFVGWGESPLYAKKVGVDYVGIELNKAPMEGYILPYIQTAIDSSTSNNAKVKIRLGDSSVFQPDLVDSFDLCYTSPPYFDFEEYGFSNSTIFDCSTYEEFHERVTKPIFANVYKYLKVGGILALQTEKDPKAKAGWIRAIAALGFKLVGDTITGQEANKYSKMSKRDQSLIIFEKPEGSDS